MEIDKVMLQKVVSDLAVETRANYSLLGSSDNQYCVYLNGMRRDHVPQVPITSWDNVETVYHEVQLLRRFHRLLQDPVFPSEEFCVYPEDIARKCNFKEDYRPVNTDIWLFLNSFREILKLQADTTYTVGFKTLQEIVTEVLPKGTSLKSRERVKGLFLSIPSFSASHSGIDLYYKERLSDDDTPDPSDDILVIAEKDLKKFEEEILNYHESFCDVCYSRLNRIDQKCSFCHDPMPEDPLLVLFFSSKRIIDFRQTVLDFLQSHEYITHEQLIEESEKFELTTGEFNIIITDMLSNRDLLSVGDEKYKVFNT